MKMSWKNTASDENYCNKCRKEDKRTGKLLLYDYYDGDKEPAISDKNSRKSSKKKLRIDNFVRMTIKTTLINGLELFIF